jgi:hypothetical protein
MMMAFSSNQALELLAVRNQLDECVQQFYRSDAVQGEISPHTLVEQELRHLGAWTLEDCYILCGRLKQALGTIIQAWLGSNIPFLPYTPLRFNRLVTNLQTVRTRVMLITMDPHGFLPATSDHPLIVFEPSVEPMVKRSRLCQGE